MSSTATSTRRSRASSRRALRKPSATARGSAGAPSRSSRRRAVASARPCGRGRMPMISWAYGPSRSTAAAKARADSASVGLDVRVSHSRLANSTPYRQSVVFPIPASPSRTRTPGAFSQRKLSMTCTSSSRPTISMGVPTRGHRANRPVGSQGRERDQRRLVDAHGPKRRQTAAKDALKTPRRPRPPVGESSREERKWSSGSWGR